MTRQSSRFSNSSRPSLFSRSPAPATEAGVLPTAARFGRGVTAALLVIGVSLLLPGCAADSGAGYRPIIDANNPTYDPAIKARYSSDLAECQQVAEQRSYFNGNRVEEMVIGGLIGTGVGLASARKWGHAGAGAGIGAAAVGLGGAFETRDERQQIVINCMTGRGHKVVG